MHVLIEPGSPASIAIEPLTPELLAARRRKLTAAQRRWLELNDFCARPGQWLLLGRADGRLDRVLLGVDPEQPLAALAGLPYALPEGSYQLTETRLPLDQKALALGWALGAYRFQRYHKSPRPPAQLAVPPALLAQVEPLQAASYLVRDLVNTPTEDLGPKQLADAVKRVAKTHKAKLREWVGEELIKANFPTIHAVGRASHREPRLIELNWGLAEHPLVVIIGKGVCFDTGGLDLKPSAGMRWMKKDMGGAAHALALAQLIMGAKLPLRLCLLIPAVENAVAGNALRPGEVVTTRAGYTVEIDNTDAEGRLILCDALSYGAEREPELILDFATLTGAARVALGPDLPALFSNREALALALTACGREVHDPLWQLPLWQPYRRMLDSHLADFANSGPSGHAGAITAALYLERFVPAAIPWLHLDTYAWNDAERPGRPRGGEAMGLRACFSWLTQRYGTASA